MKAGDQKTKEMVMSTLALWRADAAAAPGVQPNAQPGLFQRFFQRLLRAREADATRRIYWFLATQSDERLKDLGYTAEDIQCMRRGQFRFPAR
jgi:hypothetical protein